MRFIKANITQIIVTLALIFFTLTGLFMVSTMMHPSYTIQKKIVVFAGAAAAPVYEYAAALFEQKYEVIVELKLGGSGNLLSHMQITKTGDVYIPGSPDYILKAQQVGVINTNTTHIKKLAWVVPAIIVPKGNPKNITNLEDLKKPGVRVGIGDPETVCVGLYAKELLEKNKLWNDVRKNIVTYAQSCDATATLVYIGVVDAVIGWHVFYYWNPEKSDIIWIEPNRIPKIGYIVGAVTNFSNDKELSMRFLDFLASQEMSEIWKKHGYFPTEYDAKQYAANAQFEELR